MQSMQPQTHSAAESLHRSSSHAGAWLIPTSRSNLSRRAVPCKEPLHRKTVHGHTGPPPRAARARKCELSDSGCEGHAMPAGSLLRHQSSWWHAPAGATFQEDFGARYNFPMIDASERQELDEKGFIVLRDFIPPDMLQALRNRIDELYAEE